MGKRFAFYAKCALPAGFDIEKLHKFVSLDFGFVRFGLGYLAYLSVALVSRLGFVFQASALQTCADSQNLIN